MTTHRNPVPTVDIIIEMQAGGIVLIERKNPPFGWAMPGGFVDYGESLETAARREALEETSLVVKLTTQLHAYSDPDRDKRLHTITTVFVAEAQGEAEPVARDDAKGVGVFTEEDLPTPLAFDHKRILSDYFRWKLEGFRSFDPFYSHLP
ncbi:MAG: NUDIX domain-containing protein [Thermodesulfobacteriota bacterium]